VVSDLHTNGIANRAPTGVQDDIVAQVLAWWHDDRSRTHSESCWQWHPECAVAILGAEVEHRQAQIELLRVAGDAMADAIAVVVQAGTSAGLAAALIWEARRG
jgi:hypothetical protein